MDKEKINELITSAAKTIFSYCRSRTNTKEEAEDLSQDIFVQLLKSKGSFNNEKAFYGFMWAVAGNVYRDWCRKRKKVTESELDENISDNSISLAELLEKETNLKLLYRELSLLTEQYRKVIIKYYFDGTKVSDISKSLNISESMVKFLLFKSRKILKEGMNMERVIGDLGFNPRKMVLCTWGEIADESYCDVCNDSLIAQNILFACYYERCTAEEISIQIGVSVPYLEKELKKLCDQGILINKGSKYETAVIIFTKEYFEEVDEKTLHVKKNTAKIIEGFLNEHLEDIKSIGFHTGVSDDNRLKLHVAGIILAEANIEKYQKSLDLVFPIKYTGKKMFVCGEENYQSLFGGHRGHPMSNSNDDKIIFMHIFKIGGNFSHFVNHQNRVNIALDIARDKCSGFSENDMNEITEFIKRGFVKKIGDTLSLNLPVFTSKQYKELLLLIDNVTTAVAKETKELVKISTDILMQHTPVAMKKEAKNMGWIRMIDAVPAPAIIMMEDGFLQQVAENTFPTSWIVLSE